MSPSFAAVADLRCNLLWESDSSLVIGWFDTVMILQIKARPLPPSGRISPGQPTRYEGLHSSCLFHPAGTHASNVHCVDRVGEIAVRWKADCVISGMYPFDVDSMALLGYVTIGREDFEDDDEDEEPTARDEVGR